ncbi:MAG: bifunctional 5,10-methylene-tetrahydrofolate dehydrogenase/5,10-methylene-tetrahydrofolate cyclohydrolase [Treponema sp.]|jgi:methylenetetrahydrofolate dehydrogenase (NADP+)/methenyltetrahydrofolate cyclohydrolase|nr:bifunctional 5,10-methylene-tetrahydrofolate dehydrogenase/5,10-methylene-tetrahydrofolate cyclohydrolase [Treponema sp.]
MAAVIIDGKAIAGRIRAEVKERTAILRERGVVPCLAVILAGNDPASLSYVSAKEKALQEAGMASMDIRLARETAEGEILARIAALNADARVHGILVQLPLPGHIAEDRVITAIDPAKDVDGFHPVSAGNLLLGRPGFVPCTPNGVLALLREMGIPTAGAHAVVVGRSNIVGRPLANLLTRRDVNATVTVCHTGTADLARHTRQADILIAAAGRPALITADMVREGAAVIDVGVNRVNDPLAKKGYRLCGDADFQAVAEKAACITPVPGGVGPMTIAMLLRNVAEAAEKERVQP